jgi:hypothetical protein
VKTLNLKWLAAIAVAIASVAPTAAHAGNLVVAADVNIFDHAFSFPGDDEVPSIAVDPGNQQFLRNLLGNGNRVMFGGFRSPASTFSVMAGDNYFRSLPGVATTFDLDTLIPTKLAAVDLLILAMRDTPYAPQELDAIADFVHGDGTLFIVSENASYPQVNAIANSLLTHLNSGIAVSTDILEGAGYETLTGPSIAVTATTADVTTFTYGVSGTTTGGTPLFFNTDDHAFVTTAAVPEPATMAAAVAAIAMLGRRR